MHRLVRLAMFTSCCLLMSTLGLIAPAATPAGAQGAQSRYVPAFVALRALDTRDSGVKAAGGVPYTIALPGSAAGATAADLNVTVVDPSGPGYITLAPAGGALPTVSNLNFVTGETTANHAIVAVSGGQITYLSAVDAHVIIDVNGWWS